MKAEISGYHNKELKLAAQEKAESQHLIDLAIFLLRRGIPVNTDLDEDKNRTLEIRFVSEREDC